MIMVGPWVQLVGRDHGLQIGGVKLLGFNAINAHKLLLTMTLPPLIIAHDLPNHAHFGIALIDR